MRRMLESYLHNEKEMSARAHVKTARHDSKLGRPRGQPGLRCMDTVMRDIGVRGGGQGAVDFQKFGQTTFIRAKDNAFV